MFSEDQPFKYYPSFIEEDKAKEYYRKLVRELKFKKSEIYIYNRYVEEPRLGTYHSKIDNSIDDTRYVRKTEEFTPTLDELLEKVNKFLGIEFNSVLCNLYRNGDDHIGWHSDREEREKPIASLSFGATRKFRLRKIYKTKGWDYEYHLKGGDLILMEKGCQKEFKHSVPKEKAVKRTRLNLTFRIF